MKKESSILLHLFNADPCPSRYEKDIDTHFLHIFSLYIEYFGLFCLKYCYELWHKINFSIFMQISNFFNSGKTKRVRINDTEKSLHFDFHIALRNSLQNHFKLSYILNDWGKCTLFPLNYIQRRNLMCDWLRFVAIGSITIKTNGCILVGLMECEENKKKGTRIWLRVCVNKCFEHPNK